MEGLVQVYQTDFFLYHYDPKPFLWMAEAGQKESERPAGQKDHLTANRRNEEDIGLQA